MDDKWYVCGDFRAGKTTFCRRLLEAAPRSLVWDPVWEYDDAPATAKVWQPRDMEAQFPAFLREALRSEDALVVVDEPALVMDSRSTPPLAWDLLWRLGHKRGIGVVVATHRPVGDLPALTRVVHHWVAFRLSSWTDREHVGHVLGPVAAEWLARPPKHAWWHHGPEHQGPMAPLRVEGRGRSA